MFWYNKNQTNHLSYVLNLIKHKYSNEDTLLIQDVWYLTQESDEYLGITNLIKLTKIYQFLKNLCSKNFSQMMLMCFKEKTFEANISYNFYVIRFDTINH